MIWWYWAHELPRSFKQADFSRHMALSTKFPSLLSSTVFTRSKKAVYHKNVIDHYEHPRNVGALDKNDPNVGTGIVGSPACGDVMKLQIKVNFLDNMNLIEINEVKLYGH